MCLWTVQVCPRCEAVTSVPTVAPQRCRKPNCHRLTLDPNNLQDEMQKYLDDDEPCRTSCHWQTCGHIICYRYCGEHNALRQECELCGYASNDE